MSNKSIATVKLDFTKKTENDMLTEATDFYRKLASRRSVRDFSDQTVPRAIIEQSLLAAGTAPSGANRQPWHFAVVNNSELKRQIRLGAEKEEQEFYSGRAPKDWLDALAPLGTNANKPFLETAPYLIVVFAEKLSQDYQGNKQKNYYVTESVSIATGLLLASLHISGLATLTHTPAPMKFLNTLLNRPVAEKPLMILVVGYPAEGAQVSAITRKSLDEFSSFLE